MWSEALAAFRFGRQRQKSNSKVVALRLNTYGTRLYRHVEYDGTVRALHPDAWRLSSAPHKGGCRHCPVGALRVSAAGPPRLSPGKPTHAHFTPHFCVYFSFQKGRQTVVKTSERRLAVFKKQMTLKHTLILVFWSL